MKIEKWIIYLEIPTMLATYRFKTQSLYYPGCFPRVTELHCIYINYTHTHTHTCTQDDVLKSSQCIIDFFFEAFLLSSYFVCVSVCVNMSLEERSCHFFHSHNAVDVQCIQCALLIHFWNQFCFAVMWSDCLLFCPPNNFNIIQPLYFWSVQSTWNNNMLFSLSTSSQPSCVCKMAFNAQAKIYFSLKSVHL